MKKKLWIGILVGCISGLSFAIPALAFEYDVIVNPASKITSVSKDELKQIFLANQLKWASGDPVTLVMYSPGGDDADNISKEFMAMTSWQAKNHYLKKVFSGAMPSQPEYGDTIFDIVNIVAKLPAAISVVPKGGKLDRVKVIQLR